MSQKNVELVRAIYTAWAEGRSARDLIEPDMEYVNPPYALESGTHRDRRRLGRIRDVCARLTVPQRGNRRCEERALRASDGPSSERRGTREAPGVSSAAALTNAGETK